MPNYIALLKWTEKGIAGVQGSAARSTPAGQLSNRLGLK